MRRSISLAGIIAVALPAVTMAAQASDTRALSLPAQPLGASLQAIARQFGIELLFSQDMVAGRLAPPISARLQAQQALELALAGSNLTVRRTAEGSYIITVASVAQSSEPAATPDILVIGRRTQNTDIRRTQNDVRPYQLVTRKEIASSHVATVEELAAKRLPANAQGATTGQQGAGAYGETSSSIDLRGLGTGQTLILVDGHRLPQLPGQIAGFGQSDVNAIPPEAIERVEAITATAGGIYGPGATAGVVNLILRRDYRGVDLSATSGITSRGDAPYRRVDLRAGFTPDHGSTDVMIDVAKSNFGGLDVGARDFAARANSRSFDNDPSLYISSPPASASLNVISQDGTALVLKPAYGGAALGSAITFAPTADGRSASALGQTLAANAGRFDTTPSVNAVGDRGTLLSGRRTTSVIASARRRLGRVEIFADYLFLENRGYARRAIWHGTARLNAADPANPFQQDITIYAPGPYDEDDFAFRTRVTRAAGGLIADLPAGWRGEADYSFGTARRGYEATGSAFTLAGYTSYLNQQFLGEGPHNPLGNYSDYLASYDGLLGPSSSDYSQRNHYSNASLRLAGPIIGLPGGNLSATLLAEQRRERVRGGTIASHSPLLELGSSEPLADYGQIVRSLYGEARAPLIDATSGFRPLRGLELQLAVRRDDVTTDTSQNRLAADGGGIRTVRNIGTVYTGGLKFSPFSGVLLRASISTGQQPLPVDELARAVFTGLAYTENDPKRPRDFQSGFAEVTGAAPNPTAVAARSISAGIVVQPVAVPRLRLSVDYTHIRRRNENIFEIVTGVDYYLANEALYPGRVVRAPLTPEDAARGYTGGAIEQVDTTSLQNGSTTIDAIDALIDYTLALKSAGTLDLHAAATWQPRFRRFAGLGVPSRNYSSAYDGALAVRGNAGARWNHGPLSLTLDGQFTGGYRLTSAIEYQRANDETIVIPSQGSSRIGPRATLDIGAEYRVSLAGSGFAGRPRTLEFRFGIQDILDSRAPTVIRAPGEYSSYADPRRRRFELTVAAGL